MIFRYYWYFFVRNLDKFIIKFVKIITEFQFNFNFNNSVILISILKNNNIIIIIKLTLLKYLGINLGQLITKYY